MIITISGTPGSGKSTVAKALAAEMKYEHVYMGQIMRDRAANNNMTVGEYMEYLADHPEEERSIDKHIGETAKDKNNLIIESRVAFHFLPDSLKIFIKSTPEISAERIYNQSIEKMGYESRHEAKYASVREAFEATQARQKLDEQRYFDLYNIRAFDESNYDIVIDTSHLDAQEAFNKTYQAILAR